MMKYSKKRIKKMVADKIWSTEQPLTIVQLSMELKIQRVTLQPVVRAMVEDGTIEMVKPGGDLAPTFSLPEASRLHPVHAKAVNPEHDHGISNLALTQSLSSEVAVTHTANVITESALETDPMNVDEPVLPIGSVTVLQIDPESVQHDTSISTEKIRTEEHNGVGEMSELEEAGSPPVFRTWASKTKAVRSYPIIDVGDIKRIINGRYKGENYLPTFVSVGEIGFWIPVNQDLLSSGWFPFFIPGAFLLIDANKMYMHKKGVYLVHYTPQAAYGLKRLEKHQRADQPESGMIIIGIVVDVRMNDIT